MFNLIKKIRVGAIAVFIMAGCVASVCGSLLFIYLAADASTKYIIISGTSRHWLLGTRTDGFGFTVYHMPVAKLRMPMSHDISATVAEDMSDKVIFVAKKLRYLSRLDDISLDSFERESREYVIEYEIQAGWPMRMLCGAINRNGAPIAALLISSRTVETTRHSNQGSSVPFGGPHPIVIRAIPCLPLLLPTITNSLVWGATFYAVFFVGKSAFTTIKRRIRFGRKQCIACGYPQQIVDVRIKNCPECGLPYSL